MFINTLYSQFLALMFLTFQCFPSVFTFQILTFPFAMEKFKEFKTVEYPVWQLSECISSNDSQKYLEKEFEELHLSPKYIDFQFDFREVTSLLKTLVVFIYRIYFDQENILTDSPGCDGQNTMSLM